MLQMGGGVSPGLQDLKGETNGGGQLQTLLPQMFV